MQVDGSRVQRIQQIKQNPTLKKEIVKGVNKLDGIKERKEGNVLRKAAG